jgi:hypothetical protein
MKTRSGKKTKAGDALSVEITDNMMEGALVKEAGS